MEVLGVSSGDYAQVIELVTPGLCINFGGMWSYFVYRFW